MSKWFKLGAACLICLILVAPLAHAGEGGRRARGGEPEVGRAPRASRGGAAGGAAGRAGQVRKGRELNMPLVASEKARAELQRHRAVLAELAKSIGELRAEIKKAGKDGKEAAIKDNLEKAKALAGRIIAEYATHLANMKKIAEEEGEVATDKLTEIILKGQPDRGGDGPRRPEGAAKAGAAENKVEEGEANPFHE